MNNRRTAPGGQTTHMLSAILAKVTNIEKLLAPYIICRTARYWIQKVCACLPRCRTGHF